MFTGVDFDKMSEVASKMTFDKILDSPDLMHYIDQVYYDKYTVIISLCRIKSNKKSPIFCHPSNGLHGFLPILPRMSTCPISSAMAVYSLAILRTPSGKSAKIIVP